eukprot:TRINITY_DN433_c0_g1_i3.p3 TRINITY_DN433_c0_g1~~TRINITY_DN433_c0_g1_i3.p3  ORF type:complete len:123 (-),score=34.34 TRINITY_DN433_c0_g1_i3:286-654(-)
MLKDKEKNITHYKSQIMISDWYTQEITARIAQCKEENDNLEAFISTERIKKYNEDINALKSHATSLKEELTRSYKEISDYERDQENDNNSISSLKRILDDERKKNEQLLREKEQQKQELKSK